MADNKTGDKVAEKNPQTNHWVGFDLGGTKMLSAVFDDNFKLLSKDKKKSKGHEGSKAGLDRIRQTIEDALEKAEIKTTQLSGIGIGCPGPLDLEQGILKTAPNLGWTDVPIKEYLEQKFGVPVVVANDVDAGVFGEYSFGAGKGARCVVGIFPGTGIGGGCVYEGKIFHGANCTCLEIGHIPLVANGPLDGCNNAGSLESLASRLSISSAAAQAALRGQAPHLLENVGTDLKDIRSSALANSAEVDKSVRLIIEHAANHIGLAVVTIVHLLAPDVVVLGGGLVEAMPDRFLKQIEKSAAKRVLPSFRDVFKIKVAELGDDATVCGAAAWAKRAIQDA